MTRAEAILRDLETRTLRCRDAELLGALCAAHNRLVTVLGSDPVDLMAARRALRSARQLLGLASGRRGGAA